MSYDKWATLFCVGSLFANISASKYSVELLGRKEAPCGCHQRPMPGIDPINPDCFVPSDQNYDPAARHPHQFKLSTSTWRGDTGYALLKVEGDMLVHDMTEAFQNTPAFTGTRAYLYEGAGLGERYGQWQVTAARGTRVPQPRRASPTAAARQSPRALPTASVAPAGTRVRRRLT